jgi:BirA family biotin operon repressor/biotin-[acetyl-CoA-carboxylase] ligase
MLSDGQFRSGEEMARRLGVSRATVSNAVRELDAVGVTVNKVHGRGYQLVHSVQFLELERILKDLGPCGDRLKIKLRDVVGSTNSVLSQAVSANAASGTCVVAELQTEGRGRRGRVWHTSLGGAVTFSLLWRFNQGAAFLSGLSLAVGVALMRALEDLGVRDAALKWPNDLLHGHRKLAGTLIELQGDMLGPTAAVIGIGVNLRLSDLARDQIDQAVTDLHDVLGEMPDRSHVLASILIHLVTVLDMFEVHGFGPLREEWESYHAYHGKPVRLLMPGGQNPEGVVVGVADDGALLVRRGGEIQPFSAGELSLRPVQKGGV